jgi:protein ImuB
MTRILFIWLPNLAIERWRKTSDCAPDAPVVLTVEGTHGLVIHAVTREAAERGARVGARLTDARALDPSLVAIPANLEDDAVFMRRLASWAQRWSPLVEIDKPDGLRLDVTGVAHLFGGETGLVGDIHKRLRRLGLTAQIAIAPTAAAAWALAHHSPSICAPDELEAKCAPLHVSALQLDPETVRTLERLGLKTIGALTGVPRLALARRFRGAEDVVDALDRMLGRKTEPLTAEPINPLPRALLKLEEPAAHPEAASQGLERLIPELVRQLQERHLGARKLSLTGYRVDGSTAIASVATAIPSREPKHLQRLLADKAAALNPEFGFDAFALTAEWAEHLSSAQDSLVEEPGGERELARLIDRLTVKLGPRAVRRPQAEESHLPERASRWAAAVFPSLSREGLGVGGGPAASMPARELLQPHRAASSAPTPNPSPEGEGKRPQRLLDRPEAIDVIYATPEGMPRRFRWRRAVHDIARAEGPERIAPEWWRQPSRARLRDYYRIEDEEGRRYWIYREGLAGDGRGGPPNWFIHGLFG